MLRWSCERLGTVAPSLRAVVRGRDSAGRWLASVSSAELRRSRLGSTSALPACRRPVSSASSTAMKSVGVHCRWHSTSAETSEGATAEDAHSSDVPTVAAGPPPVSRACEDELVGILQEAVELSAADDIVAMLQDCKSAAEVCRVMERLAYRHPLCFDVLNGHGYRVRVLQTLTSVAPRTNCMYEWFDCVNKFRRLGFVLTRTFAAEGFTTIRQWITHTFSSEGRTPHILAAGTAHIRELIQWCKEDRLVFDHVLYARIVFLLTMIAGVYDRQNLFRASFPPSFTKRDGIVVEWVVGTERCVDFDECVLQCDTLMEEVLDMMRREIPSRPVFSVVYRLIDYYFATDNVEKMIAVMEDACGYGMNVAESSTAKLMQLACAMNYPSVPELFMRWRVALPQCVLATPDMSRLMFLYSRSGGGKPCPLCGEPFNHRNVSVYCWQRTPPHQRTCPALRMAQRAKGELEECRELPQNSDWSAKAFQLWELSRSRAIEWGAVEWRAFLLCCMFAPPSEALRAKQLVDDHFDVRQMDDFLRATYMRLLRHYAPEEAPVVIKRWQNLNGNMSPIALQEGLMAAAMIEDPVMRIEGLRHVWSSVLAKNSYVMPFTKRFFEKRAEELAPHSSPEEKDLLQEVINMMPRHVSLLDMKDSASDYVVGTTRKNVYIPTSVLRKLESRKAARPKSSR